jgi:hypothetical protein
MKITEWIRYLLNRSKSHQVETIIISQKQCPHCTSRGMFVFNDTTKIKSKIGESNEKHK